VTRDLLARSTLTALLLSGTVATLFTNETLVRAAVPANVIKGWQDNAPESMDITVQSVEKSSTARAYNAVPGGSVTTIDVTLHAKIDVVRRSASDLTPGKEIVVRYVVQHYDPVAPPDGNYGIILSPQDHATAYLKKVSDGSFELNCIFGCLVKP
jgi:hypothetical protein